MEHDKTVPKGKPTSPHALENELITTIVVSDNTTSQTNDDKSVETTR